jgi:hypothetical protein
MNDSPESNPKQEKVQQQPSQQSDEEIRAYWTPARQQEAKPLPIPQKKPPVKTSKKTERSQTAPAAEVVQDPVEPNAP